MHMFYSDTDMNEFMPKVCPEGEHYLATAYGDIQGSAAEIMMFGALASRYSYVGVTEHHFVIVETGAGNDRINSYAVIPYEDITKLKLGSMLNNYTIRLETQKGKLKVNVAKSKGLHKCENQKANAKILMDTLKQYAK